MKQEPRHFLSLCLIIPLIAGAGALHAYDVVVVSGQPSTRLEFIAGRDSRRIEHYVVVSPSGKCAGMITGRASGLDANFIVQRPSSRGEFCANMPSGVVGYIVSCPSSCLPNLIAGCGATLVGYLSGTAGMDGYIVTGSSETIPKFLVGCSSSLLRGWLVSRTSWTIPSNVCGQPSSPAFSIVSRSSYVRKFLVSRPSCAIKQYISSAPSGCISHMLVHPGTAARQFIVGYPSSCLSGFLSGESSEIGPAFIADTQCK